MKEMTIKEVQTICLDILKDVHQFCVENNIKYSLSGGTLLGAIRHNGFIPWDDDVDIQIPRPDYNRFIHSYKSKKGYQLFSREIEGGEKVKVRLTKICEMEKTYMDNGPYTWTNVETGVGIDVIPVDGAPDSLEEMKQHVRKLRSFGWKVNAWRVKDADWMTFFRYSKMKDKLKFLIRKVLAPFISDYCLDNFIQEQMKYDYDSSSFFCAGLKNGIGEWQPKENMQDFVLHRFENEEFYIMSGYEENLRGLFGDYMQLPPVNQRNSHGFYRYYWR